ncbi:MAG: polysaccharide biosynthesis C-terminal domain-containing protein, partial [Bacteroidales bacterium]|nr:polysaccharide biosynthesis C-terminal domain-containing protein [Bacteroidales bacterium]
YILSFFGEEFIVGYSALILIVVGWIFNAWAGPVVAMMNMINLHKEVQNIYIIVALVNILLNGLLIPKFGITGAAIASMMSAILINLFTVFIVFKKEGFFILYLPEFLHKLSRT